MYIICSNCGNDKYWVDYGPTECHQCDKWNTHDGTSPFNMRCLFVVSFNDHLSDNMKANTDT